MRFAQATRSTGAWYATHLPEFLGGKTVVVLALVVLLIAVLGLALGLVGYFQARKPRATRIALGLLACLPAIVAQMTVSMIFRQAASPLQPGRRFPPVGSACAMETSCRPFCRSTCVTEEKTSSEAKPRSLQANSA